MEIQPHKRNRSLLRRIAGPAVGLGYAAASIGECAREFYNGTTQLSEQGAFFTGEGLDKVLHYTAMPAEQVSNAIQSVSNNLPPSLAINVSGLALYATIFMAAGWAIQKGIEAGIKSARDI